MKSLKKGLILALVQVLLITLVGAKLMIDRARYPQVWVETAPYDPDLPLRGRYVRLMAVVEPGQFSDPRKAPGLSDPSSSFETSVYHKPGRVEIREGRLVAIRDDKGPLYFTNGRCGARECLTLAEPLAFFIPENIPDPSIRNNEEQLWVKVTIPPRGAPRPIELGVKKDGKLRPLEL